MTYVECQECGKSFRTFPSALKAGRGKYCSNGCKCRAFEKRPGPLTSQWKGGLVEIVCIECGETKKVKQCQADQQYCSKECVGKETTRRQKGENNPSWKGGVSKEYQLARKTKEYFVWRVAVFERDDWTCQRCGVRGGRLNPHHIKSFSEYRELRYVVENGVTYCEQCHYAKHKEQGDKTFGRV